MSLFSAIYRNEDVAAAVAEKPERTVFAVARPEEADLLWGVGFIAAAPVDGTWDDAKAEKLEGMNVIVLGDCGGLEKRLQGQTKTCLWVNVPNVAKWFAGLHGDKKQAVVAFCNAARQGRVTNAAELEVSLEDLLAKVSLNWHNLNVAFLAKRDVHGQAVVLLESVSRVVESTKPKEG